jgi:radical SAM superfamily enzyme YgiQ (UPF0313 family)
MPSARKAPADDRKTPRYLPKNARNMLCVFPKHTPSYASFHHIFPLMGRQVKAAMPPQGLLVIAAYLPATWNVRFIDEGVREATDADFAWADAVLVSGMHIQRDQMLDINARAHRHHKPTVLGGPSVTAVPEQYADFDILHLGELGDATEALIVHLDLSIARPAEQLRFETKERLPLCEFPTPAYHMLDMGNYFIGDIQFSSGCPYTCDFCDIPALYGRKIRTKTPEQISDELDAMLAAGPVLGVYFVDDNFIGRKKETKALLRHLAKWQKRRRYPVQLACEATLNLAKDKEMLELMRDAYFCTVFCGIETPDPEALDTISKRHNLMNDMPIPEAISVINSYGLEVSGGLLFGLDTDTPQTADRYIDFVRQTNIPMLSINLVFALPKTPLWKKMEEQGRLDHSSGRESNIRYLMPHDQVVSQWKKCVSTVYSPSEIYQRFWYNVLHTYPNRIKLPRNAAQNSWSYVKRGLRYMKNIFWHAGFRGSYRRVFWKTALKALFTGRLGLLINVALVSHHLILFAKECVSGSESASFFAPEAKKSPRELPMASAGTQLTR